MCSRQGHYNVRVTWFDTTMYFFQVFVHSHPRLRTFINQIYQYDCMTVGMSHVFCYYKQREFSNHTWYVIAHAATIMMYVCNNKILKICMNESFMSSPSQSHSCMKKFHLHNGSTSRSIDLARSRRLDVFELKDIVEP